MLLGRALGARVARHGVLNLAEGERGCEEILPELFFENSLFWLRR